AARGRGRCRRSGEHRRHLPGGAAAQRDRGAAELAMAIVEPGKRPGPRIEQSRVFSKKFARGKKSGYAGLMLTSLVDMFTIIVIFLLQNFSATGEIILSKDIKLPDAQHGAALEVAPMIAISGEAVTFQAKMVVQTDDPAK